MKTIYTLLLAFGLFFTSHAQEYQNLSSDSNLQLSASEKSEFEEISYGSHHMLLFGVSVETYYHSNSPVKKVIIAQEAGVSLLNSYASSLHDVTSLELIWRTNEVYHFSNQLHQKLPNLKYIFVKSYDLLTPSLVETIIGTLKQQFPNVKILYLTMKDS